MNETGFSRRIMLEIMVGAHDRMGERFGRLWPWIQEKIEPSNDQNKTMDTKQNKIPFLRQFQTLSERSHKNAREIVKAIPQQVHIFRKFYNRRIKYHRYNSSL